MLKLKLFYLFLLYINYKNYYVVKCQNRNEVCDFTTKEDDCEYQNVKSGDKITFKCKHSKKFTYQYKDIGDYSQRCYVYVKDSYNEDVKLTNTILRINDFSSTESDGITTTVITIPPFIYEDKDFRCDCYIDTEKKEDDLGNDNLVKRTLTVHIKKEADASNLGVKGCNARKWDTGSNLPKLIYVNDPDVKNVCNVYDIKSSDYVTAICQNSQTLDPPDCFTHVYIYKNVYEYSQAFVDDDQYEKVNMNTLLSNKDLKSVEGGTTSKYWQIPENVTEKFLFFCSCKNKNNRTTTRMNFFVNILDTDPLNTWQKIIPYPIGGGFDPSIPLEPVVPPGTNPDESPMTPDQGKEIPAGSKPSEETNDTTEQVSKRHHSPNKTGTHTDKTKDTTEKNNTRAGRNFSCNITFSLLSLCFITFAYIF